MNLDINAIQGVRVDGESEVVCTSTDRDFVIHIRPVSFPYPRPCS